MNQGKRNDILIVSLIVAVILMFRILYVDVFQSLIVKYGFNITDLFQSFVSNIVALLLSVVLDIIGVSYLSKIRPYGHNNLTRFFYDITLIAAVSALGAFILNYNDLVSPGVAFKGQYYLFAVLSILMLNAFMVVVMDMVFYALRIRETMRTERLQKRQAEFQYHKLKEQLNPHFLFNSLNMLDYLVQSSENDRASVYIKKLASIYRYLLQTNDEELVTIDRELQFVGHYVDLLKVRFSEGLDFRVDVPQEFLNKLIIPCGLQILVENAIKHNVVSQKEPLLIEIKIEEGKLIVLNNIQLRLNVNESMNIGLNNICAQYRDVVGQSVDIQMTDKEFVVKLPVI